MPDQITYPEEQETTTELPGVAPTVAGIRSSRGHRDTGLSDLAHEVVQREGSAAEEWTAGGGITVVVFHPGEGLHQVDMEQIPRLLDDERSFLWIDLSDYRQQDLCRVAEMLGLHRIAVHAALSHWQRPRLDVFPDHFFVSVTVARLVPQEYRVHAGQLDIFVGRSFVVSTHKNSLPFASEVLVRAQQNPALLHDDPAFMLYIMLDELLEHYEDLNESVQDEIERMEEQALLDTSDDFLRHLLQVKRYAFALVQLAEHHRNIFEAFLRPDFPFVSGEHVDVYFRDLEARLSRLLDTLSSAKESVNGAFEIYVSHVSHRTNNVMKILTMVSTILLPVTVILAFFGTSFHSLSFLYTPPSFVVMVLLILLISTAILSAFWRKGWL